VEFVTEDLEVVGCGGSGICNEYCESATTLHDKSSWWHANGGHGLTMERTLSFSLDSTTTDSNTGTSTNIDILRCAGYTITMQSSGYTSPISGSIGFWVRRNGVTVGRLAHYDNTSREWVVDATSTIASGGTYTLKEFSDGTGATGTGAGTDSSVQKNSHGTYAKGCIGINMRGGHHENHLYGIFLDACTNGSFHPGYLLTQGANAWGLYLAGATANATMGGFGTDVQAGGAGDVYFGILTTGNILLNGHKSAGYTFTNRSSSSLVITDIDGNGLKETLKTILQSPVEIDSSHSSGLLVYLNASATTGTPVCGHRLQTNVSPGYAKDIYLDSAGNFLFKSSAQGKSLGVLGSGGDRADQRQFWATDDGQRVLEIGPTTGQMTGSDAGADFTLDLYDDSGNFIATGLKISRSGRWAQILAGKSSSKAKVGGIIYVSTSEVGNITTSETDLFNYSIPANMLWNNNDALRITFYGKMASNANNKKVRFYTGPTVGLNTGSGIGLNGAEWNASILIMRVGGTSQKTTAVWNSNNADNRNHAQYSTPAETLSGSVTIKATGEAISSNDILLEGVQIEYLPAA
jgi:hypothetical protein